MIVEVLLPAIFAADVGRQVDDLGLQFERFAQVSHSRFVASLRHQGMRGVDTRDWIAVVQIHGQEELPRRGAVVTGSEGCQAGLSRVLVGGPAKLTRTLELFEPPAVAEAL